MSKCKGCGAEIVWIQTENGKSMPCNAEKVFKRFKYCYEHNTSVYVEENKEK